MTKNIFFFWIFGTRDRIPFIFYMKVNHRAGGHAEILCYCCKHQDVLIFNYCDNAGYICMYVCMTYVYKCITCHNKSNIAYVIKNIPWGLFGQFLIIADVQLLWWYISHVIEVIWYVWLIWLLGKYHSFGSLVMNNALRVFQFCFYLFKDSVRPLCLLESIHYHPFGLAYINHGKYIILIIFFNWLCQKNWAGNHFAKKGIIILRKKIILKNKNKKHVRLLEKNK